MLPVHALAPLVRVAVPKLVPALFITSTLTVSTRLSEKKALAPGVSTASRKQDISSSTVPGRDEDEGESSVHAKARQNKDKERIAKGCFFMWLSLLILFK